jgi:G2/mitotic-specific cyclin 3/4
VRRGPAALSAVFTRFFAGFANNAFLQRQCSVGALQIRDNNLPLQRPATRPPTAGKKRKKKKEEEERKKKKKEEEERKKKKKEEEERKKKKKEEDTFWAGSCSSNNDTKTLDKNAIQKRYGLVKDTAKVILAPMPTKETERELEAARVFVKENPTDKDKDDDKDPLMAAEYVDEIFEHMHFLEEKIKPKVHSLEDDLEGQERMKPNQTYIDCSWRRTLMDWLVAVHNEFILPPETLFLTVNWFNRFLSCTEVRINKLQLVSATALFIAAKYEGGTFLSVKDIVKITAHSYTANDVIKAELSMLNKLNFSLGWPGPLSFLRRISRADDYHLKTRTLSKYFLDVTVMDERFVDCVPSFLAAGSYCLARLMLKKGDWVFLCPLRF